MNGKEYIGSGLDLGLRLATYYFPSRFNDNRHISRSTLKYGHKIFSLVILCVLGDKDTQSKVTILNAEQKYIDLYKPALNINPVAGSSLVFKHTEESKNLMSDFRKGKNLSLEVKKKIK
jgi:group I intron endonuclease